MARSATVRDQKKEAIWRQHVRAQGSGGQTVRAYCQTHRLTEPAFYWWRAQLARRDREAPPAFVPVTVAQEGAAGADERILIELRGGRVLRLPPTLAASRVTELVRAVEAAEGGA
jgi:hypothetical protein